MSRQNGVPLSQFTQPDKQPRSKAEHDSRLDGHDSNEGKAAVILLEGRQKDLVTQRILEEQELESLEKAKIKELEEKNGWKFTSDTAGKMCLKIQDKDINTFIECNNFARDCKKAIRDDPRADMRKKGAPAFSPHALLTPDKKAQHLKRLVVLLASRNKYAQYWSTRDLPDEWFKIDNTVLCSKEEQGVLLKEVEKKKKALDKSNSSKVEVGGKSEERRALIDGIEKKRQPAVDKPKNSDVETDGKLKDERRVQIDEAEKKKKALEKSRNGNVEGDGKSKDQRRVLVGEVERKKKIVVENSRNGKVEVDGPTPRGQHRVPINDVEKKRKIGEKSKNGKLEIDGKLRDDNMLPKKRHGSQ